jgi:hypothetical protein
MTRKIKSINIRQHKLCSFLKPVFPTKIARIKHKNSTFPARLDHQKQNNQYHIELNYSYTGCF